MRDRRRIGRACLSHDLEKNRAYEEVSRIAHELQKVGPEIVNLQIKNQVAILYSVDSSNAISFMPFERQEMGWVPGKAAGSYNAILTQLHDALYRANVGSDFVFPEAADFSQYKLLIVPCLYVADDELLKKISEYVRGGGHVLMTFKSGFANENSAVRWERAPGPLREAAGFTYQEFSNLESPLPLRDNPFQVSAENKVSTWAEFLQLTSAKPLAYYEHPFFGRWPAITRNQFGAGSLTYEGTKLSDGLQDAVVRGVLKEVGLESADQSLPAAVRVKHGTTGQESEFIIT